MELNVGDYVRTKEFGINRVKWFDNGEPILENGFTALQSSGYKSSPNIIDILEVGDYVNELPVERIEGTLDDKNDIRVWFGVATYGKTALNQINHRYTVKDEFEDDYSLRFRCIKPDDIKSIVTKEQFEAMQYVVGEE